MIVKNNHLIVLYVQEIIEEMSLLDALASMDFMITFKIEPP